MQTIQWGRWLNEAWSFVMNGRNFGMFLVLGIIDTLLNASFVVTSIYIPEQSFSWERSFQEFVTTFFVPKLKLLFWDGIIIYPLYTLISAGILAVILSGIRTGQFDLSHMKTGMKPAGQLLLAGLVIGIFSGIAGFFGFVVYMIVNVFYAFTPILIFDQKQSFWAAMEESRRKVQQHLVAFFIFMIASAGIFLLGLLACGVGVFIVLPILSTALVIGYRELWPEPETTIVQTSPGPVAE